MGNVWKAMNKSQAEREAPGQADPAGQAHPAPPAESSPPVSPPVSAAVHRAEQAPAGAPNPPSVPADRGELTGPRNQAGLPVFAGPETAASLPATNGYSEELVAHHDRGGQITEEYRALRTNLLAQNPDERFCYLVTSAQPSEGKTVTTLNLGLVMAERPRQMTCIIDFDLRKPRMAKLLNVPRSPGVAEYLRGEVGLEQIIQRTVYPNLFFVPSGSIEHTKVGELAGRDELHEMVRLLRQTYDYVLFDTPPINMVSDVGALGRVTGEALLVVRMNRTHRESVDKAIRLLHSANISLSGVILTHRKFHIPNYLYRYS